MTNATGTRLFTADFEGGDFSQIVSQQEATPNQITLVNRVVGGPALEGRYTARVENDASSQGVAGSGGNYRTEMNVGQFSKVFGGDSLEGKEMWVAWDVLLDPTFPTPSAWALVTQFHAGYGSPVFALTIDPHDRLVAEARGGPVLGPGGAGNYRGAVLQNRVQRGVPIHVKVWIHWSTGSSGRIKVYLNGQLVASNALNGPNLVNGYENAPYMKCGVYRNDAPSPSIDYFDNIRWATGEAGL